MPKTGIHILFDPPGISLPLYLQHVGQCDREKQILSDLLLHIAHAHPSGMTIRALDELLDFLKVKNIEDDDDIRRQTHG